MQSVIHGVQGFMYPNEAELQWSVLIVLYPFITGPGRRRLHSGVARARVPRRSGQADLPAGAADGARVPAGRAAAAATSPGTSRAFLRDVPDAAHLVGHGDVRLRLPVVPDGGSAPRDLARLPQGHRAALAIQHRLHEAGVPRADAGLAEHQPGSAAHRRPGGLHHHHHRYPVGVPAARLRGLHLRLGEGQPLVVDAADADRVHLLRDGLRASRP